MAALDGRYEEQIGRHRGGEVEDPVIVARWPADEHVLEHLLDHLRTAAVADEVGAELAGADQESGPPRKPKPPPSPTSSGRHAALRAARDPLEPTPRIEPGTPSARW
jgi:hypothetical protein